MATSWDDAIASDFRGGYVQQARVAAHQVTEAVPPSLFVERTLLLVGWGLISATTAQWLAAAVEHDGLHHQDVSRLARIGASGAAGQNMRRDLLRTFCKNMTVPKPKIVDIPMQTRQKQLICEPTAVLRPFDLIHAMWAHHRDQFYALFGDKPRSWWDAVPADDPKLAYVAAYMDDYTWKDRTIPLLLHGDAAIFTKKKDEQSLVGIQYQSMMTDESSWIFPLFCFVKSAMANMDDHGVSTWDEMSALMVEYFTEIVDGVSTDGTSTLCDGQFVFAIWNLTGDLDWFANWWGYPHFNGNVPCWLCAADRLPASSCQLTDVHPNAGWRNNLYLHEADAPVPYTGHAITRIPCLSRWHHVGDWMHSANMGVVLYLIGGIFKEIVLYEETTGTIDQRVDRLWADIDFCYDALGVTNRIASLDKNKFMGSADNFGLMKAKAAEAKELLFSVRLLCQQRGTRDVHGNVRQLALDTLCEMYVIMDRNPRFMARDEALHLFELCDTYLLAYNSLAKDAADMGRLLYNVGFFKLHLAWHMCYYARYMNPRFLACFAFEDFMGRLTASAKACLAATPMSRLGCKVMENYLLVLELSLNGSV